MYPVILFSFSTSSSNASIPITLEVAEKKIGLSSVISSFVIPLGININKNGTAIMQGVASIFIANAYDVHIGLVGNLIIVLTATLASIGTGGVPSVGIMALIIVLRQLGVPIEGIALILGIDRLLDMARTSVNVLGNAVVACVVGKSENELDVNVYNK
jgi:Na+/H+-dicarboxylate symporter